MIEVHRHLKITEEQRRRFVGLYLARWMTGACPTTSYPEKRSALTSSSVQTFINVFKCNPADQDEVVRINTEIIDQIAVRMPGFILASVHRSTDGMRVFNYLQWESPEHPSSLRSSAAASPD